MWRSESTSAVTGCVKYPIQVQAKTKQRAAKKLQSQTEASVADARVTYPYSGPKKTERYAMHSNKREEEPSRTGKIGESSGMEFRGDGNRKRENVRSSCRASRDACDARPWNS